MATFRYKSAERVERQAYAVPLLTAADFRYICKVAYRYCGLDLRPGKEGLVQSRLAKLIRQLGMTSFKEYCSYLEGDADGRAVSAMVDCLATNHTGFFREEQHFRFLLSTIMPLIEDRQRIHIWSAACSTGEEPYSLAFALLEYFRERNKRAPVIQILATDISNRALTIAGKGVYPVEKLSHVPAEMMHEYMLRGLGCSHGLLRVKPGVRELVQFRRLNLIETFEEIEECPLILCRNVMIYFDEKTQEGLITRLAQRLESGGYLFTGHSESLNRVKHSLRYIAPAIYRRSGDLLSKDVRG